jgi:hypothetical protein
MFSKLPTSFEFPCVSRMHMDFLTGLWLIVTTHGFDVKFMLIVTEKGGYFITVCGLYTKPSLLYLPLPLSDQHRGFSTGLRSFIKDTVFWKYSD